MTILRLYRKRKHGIQIVRTPALAEKDGRSSKVITKSAGSSHELAVPVATLLGAVDVDEIG